MFERSFGFNTFGSKAFASGCRFVRSSSDNNGSLLIASDTACAVSVFVCVEEIIISVISILLRGVILVPRSMRPHPVRTV